MPELEGSFRASNPFNTLILQTRIIYYLKENKLKHTYPQGFIFVTDCISIPSHMLPLWTDENTPPSTEEWLCVSTLDPRWTFLTGLTNMTEVTLGNLRLGHKKATQLSLGSPPPDTCLWSSEPPY